MTEVVSASPHVPTIAASAEKLSPSPSVPNDEASASSPSATEDVPEGRPYRSRKNRPCDRCRRLKHRCDLPASGPPCEHCATGNASCSFDLDPPIRSRSFKSPDNEDGTKDAKPPAHQSGPSDVQHKSRKRTRSISPAIQQWSDRDVSATRSRLPGFGPYILAADRSPQRALLTNRRIDREAARGFEPFCRCGVPDSADF